MAARNGVRRDRVGRAGPLSESPRKAPREGHSKRPTETGRTQGTARRTWGLPFPGHPRDPLSFPRPRIPGELGPEAPGAPDPPLRPGLAVVEDVGRTQCSSPPPARGLRPGAREKGRASAVGLEGAEELSATEEEEEGRRSRKRRKAL